MMSSQSLGQDALDGRDDGPERHKQHVLSLKNASLSFGTLTIGDSKTLTDTLTNNSASSVVVKRAILADGNFKVDVPLPLTLAAGQSSPINVTFTPKVGGGHAAHLFISGDSSNQTAVLPLYGTAVTSTPPQLGVSPPSVNFGSVTMGRSQVQAMTLTNTGSSGLTISQATATGAGFQLSGMTLPLAIAAGQSIACSVTFTPQSTGPVSGGVSININNSGSTVSGNGKGGGSKKGSSTTTVPLAGTGAAPGLLAASPSSMGFGSVSIGSSRMASATLTNSGGSNLTISQAAAAGSGFSLSGLTLPLTLTPGQNAILNVTFAPQSSGLVNGGITITDNGSNPTLNISL
ncbi:MAG TPA: choice-of-anchor D domain-containing protein, partial [Candidatus Bathyarchaeia archaeon]|nr:choice-of-anchor D domain-containing protein [Candidatus Bathyarchaeia archaeon]